MTASRKLSVLAVGLSAILATFVVGSSIRDSRALPRVAHELWAAELTIDGFVTCVDGVADDLEGKGSRTVAHALAGDRLATCDLGAVTRSARVNLPPQLPLIRDRLRGPRRALQDATGILHQAALDARAVNAAAARYLRQGSGEAALTAGITRLQGEVQRLQELLVQAVCGGAGDTSLRLLVGCVQQDGLHAAVADSG